eukprot:3344925-Lingulodinium_polyedra.AAC.1
MSLRSSRLKPARCRQSQPCNTSGRISSLDASLAVGSREWKEPRSVQGSVDDGSASANDSFSCSA